MLDSDCYNLENTILYITDIMRQCERYPKYDGGKKLIVEEVVREFFVFMQLMSSDDLKIFGDTFIYINQFIGETENRTKKYLSNFYRVFSNMEDESIDSEVDKKYDFLKNKLQELYKKEEIEKAEDDQKKYLDTVDENDVIQCIRKKLKEHFEEVLGSLNVKRKKSNKKWTAEIELTNCNLFTDMIDKNIAETLEKEIFREIDAVLINGIIVELLEKQKISRVSRQDLKTDEEFIDFLKNNTVCTRPETKSGLDSTDAKNFSLLRTWAMAAAIAATRPPSSRQGNTVCPTLSATRLASLVKDSTSA